ncbi:MAG: hypothetical protein CM1200mP16_08920 [Nitrospina sp.]|nr:MAG: hypothetical protein CM1200mP16_08920 [Nitrospina sp.]
MNELFQIEHFLNRIQKNWNRMLFILGAYLILTVATGIMLATGLFYYLQPADVSYIAPTLLLLILGKYLFSILKSNSLKTINREKAALLTEKSIPN